MTQPAESATHSSSFHYKHYGIEQRVDALTERLLGYEAEHFRHSTNLELWRDMDDPDEGDEKAIAEAERTIAIIEKAHARTAEKLLAAKMEMHVKQRR